jgi:hypothetical protein
MVLAKESVAEARTSLGYDWSHSVFGERADFGEDFVRTRGSADSMPQPASQRSLDGSGISLAPRLSRPQRPSTLDRGDRIVLVAMLLVSWTDLRLPFNLTITDALLVLYIITRAATPAVKDADATYSKMWAALILLPGLLVSAVAGDVVALGVGLRAVISIAVPVLAMKHYFRAPELEIKLQRLCRWFAFGSIGWLAVTIQGSAQEENIYRGRSGPTDHVTSAGIFLAICLVWGFCELAASERRFLHGVAVVGASAIGLGMNASRTAIVVVIPLTLLAFKFLSGRLPLLGRRLLMGVVGIGLLVLFGKVRIASLGGGLLDRLNPSNAYSATSSRERLDALARGWREFLSSPVYGLGFRNSRLAHSVVVQVLRTSGALGGVGVVMVISKVYWASKQLVSPKSFPYGLLLLTVFLLVLPNTQVWDRFVWVLPIAVLTVASAVGHRARTVPLPTAHGRAGYV